MRLFHGRWRRLTALLAAGALEGDERAHAVAHVEGCPACAVDLAASRAALALAGQDPVHQAEPPVPLSALVMRVQARLDEDAGPRRSLSLFLAGSAVSAAVAAAVVALVLARPPSPDPAREGATSVTAGPLPPPAGVLPPDALRRLERSLERERAARYLSEAGDVLVTVASSPARCRRRSDAVEVGEEARRSRNLLARRRLYLEEDAAAVAPARTVLADVEDMLRQVAALDACAHPQDLEAIRTEIVRRRLLMKIDLVTRELQG